MQKYFKRFTFLTLILLVFVSIGFSQSLNLPSPREEKLLNGLKVLIWKQTNTGKVSINLRVHSGSAFDQQGKEGTMALLADILFPDDGIKNYFEEDLEGKLEVISNYDYIQINAEAKSDEFLSAVQTIAQAINNTQIDKETVAKVKPKRLEMIGELEKNPKYVADRAIAERLFGTFPYGRSQVGTKESLAKIDFADLIFVKERLFTADNATLAISGDVDPSYAYRAARRLFGGWQKSLNKIPANFRLPDEPDKKLKIIPTEMENVSELRFASKSIARNDSQYFAGLILSQILENRMMFKDKSYVEIKANLLPSFVVYNFSEWNIGTVKMIGNKIPLPMEIDEDVLRLFKEKISDSEFTKAKNAVTENYKNQIPATFWLDVDTYRLKSIKDDWNGLQNVKLADVQKVADEWQKETLVKILVVSKVEEPKSEENEDPKDPE